MQPFTRSSAVLPTYRPVSAEDRAQQTRRAIVRAAIEAFRLHGYSATTMGSVAVLAGVSPRTLYRHYGSKSALFAATIAAGTADFLEQLGEYVQRTTLREAILAAFTQTTLESSEESRAIMYLVVTEDEVSRYWLSTSQRMVPVLAATLRSACQADQEAEDQMVWEVRAGALLAAFNSAYRRWAVSPGSDLIELVAKAVDTVLPILTPPAIQDAPT